jgi:ABC-type uncharacterized transport system ATPase subunit
MLAAGPLRLTITMALIHRPAILFFDKPIVGLDVQSAQVIIRRRSWRRQDQFDGKTIPCGIGT